MKQNDFKIDDLVIVAGTLTGFGELQGYVTKIEDGLISVDYTPQSRRLANGNMGIVGKAHFFRPISQQQYKMKR